MAEPAGAPPVVRLLVLLLIVGLALWFIGGWVLALFGAGNRVQGTATLLMVERGTVNVSLEGGLMQRAEGSMKLFPGDKIQTGSNGVAMLSFFDGSRARLDQETELTVSDSARGSEDSTLSLELAKGTLWLKTASQSAFTGSITRFFSTPVFDLTLTPDTEALVTEKTLYVFDSDGLGVLLEPSEVGGTLYIGEGQRFTAPEGEMGSDLFAYRSALSTATQQDPFVVDSRKRAEITSGTASSKPQVETLTITTPADKAVITAATVKVEGRVGTGVSRVRVNGYALDIDPTKMTFSQELALRDQTEVDILVEALDAAGIVVGQETRTITHQTGGTASTMEAPTITSPAKTGETYRTQAGEVEIRGSTPTGAQGIMVNEYRLQLFKPGDATWGYLAGTNLGNLKAGENIFDVRAVDASGNLGAASRITILVEEGASGVVTPPAGGTSSTEPEQDESTLPTNDPLLPGTIEITAPTAGSSHVETGTGFVLYGKTSAQTDSVWVNGYKLRLYTAGKKTWSYIASVEFGTLKRGSNTYKVVARDEEGKIIDVFTYTVEYNP
jgi:hypothetical protein